MKVTVIAIAMLAAASASAQQTIDLKTAQQLAADADPRVRQLQLEADQSRLRLENIDVEKRPSLSVQGLAQYQSEVVQFPAFAGSRSPIVPKDTYDGSLYVDQLLLDPTRRARIDAEKARLAEAQARVETAMFGLRQEVNDAYFAAALLQERVKQIEHSITDLEARLKEARARVEAGTALRSEAAAIEATILQRREDVAELEANRRAALTRLGKVTDRELNPDDQLAIPDLDAVFGAARMRASSLRDRPEFAQFDAARRRLEMQKELSRTEDDPRVSAFGRAGYGKPGLNFLDDSFHGYWLAGVRLQWKPWDWGKSDRDRRIAELQQESINADEDALARQLERAIENDVATADRLAGTVQSDDRIVELRELIEKETRARYDEHVITAADYIDKETDVLDARLLRATHRVELAQAQARALNTLGVEIR